MSTVTWLDEQYGIVRNPDLNRLLERVTKRVTQGIFGMALQTELEAQAVRDYAAYPWKVLVIRNNEPNAFATGAGAVIITTGMLANLHSEAELAAVICHEIAHQLLGHTREALVQHVDVRQSTPVSAFSLDQEIAADTVGLKLLYVARYDISHALHTLSIAYRPLRGGVAGIPPNWLAKRMTNMQQRLEEYGRYRPATGSTRAFTRVKKRFFGIPG